MTDVHPSASQSGWQHEMHGLEKLDTLRSQANETLRELALVSAARRVEAMLFAAGTPLAAAELSQAVPEGTDLARVLMALQRDYEGRGVELKEVAGKWRFQTASDLSFLFHQQRQEPKRLSKAALETLAIVAYCQPVTRAEIEDVRGVSASKGTFDVLLDAGFIRLRGRRRSPGRPVTYGTTDSFLEHFGLASLDHLPGKAEFADCQLLSPQALESFSIPRPLGALAGEDSLDASGNDGTAEFTLDFLEGAVE